MDKTAKEPTTVDIRDDVETALYGFNEPITLLHLLSEELEDIYECVSKINNATDKKDRLAKQQFLASYTAERIENMTTLNNVATDLIQQNSDDILKLTKQGK